MKAIVISFEGAIKDDNIFASLLASFVEKHVNTESVNIHILSDIDVTNALIAKCLIPSAITVDRPANPQIAVVKDFCKKIIASIGSPALKTRELLNSELCKFLVQQNREVISVPVSIIAKVNTTAAYYEHRKVLKEYGLSTLPELLRDINPLFKFYQYGKEE